MVGRISSMNRPLEIRAGPPCDERAFAEIRRAALLEGCKWDPQVGNVSTLARFPLLMKLTAWERLSRLAEDLSAEMFCAEQEILNRPKLMEALGLPRLILSILQGADPLTRPAARVVRFDFHPTTEGWRISEANSDVPGGYTESSFFTPLMAKLFPACMTCGNPAEQLADALLAKAGAGPNIALLSAPGYIEDLQVTAFLANVFRARGCHAILCDPRQIQWRDGVAYFQNTRPLTAIFRFFQSDWLGRLPSPACVEHFFRGAKTPIANPAWCAITESKRFPLIWDELQTPLLTWRALLPETRDPREIDWRRDNEWLLKTAFCDTGDTISIRSLLSPAAWWKARLRARLQPNSWIAQRRFESAPIETPEGLRHVCLGIYTINGLVAGAYTRLAAKAHIDFSAVDVALLIEPNE
jgi:glutathionylspermidine synthase